MHADVIIIGAGAAGLMCAIEAGKRGRHVIVLEHNARVGEKILISGGGRCNFTNINASPTNYISQNPNFCKSALARYTPSDFIKLVEKHGINYHEKKLGQLFCDGSAQQIIQMLLEECKAANAEIRTGVHVRDVKKKTAFHLTIENDQLTTNTLVIAAGGLSIPKLGATDFGYRIAQQFGMNIIPPKPGLVPLTFRGKDTALFRTLSGISIEAEVRCKRMTFRENILFTHRGLNGPAILQISSYWKSGETIEIRLLPNIDWLKVLKENHHSQKQLMTLLEQFLPKRFVQCWLDSSDGSIPMYRHSEKQLCSLADRLSHLNITPSDTEGFSKAEVTDGGIDTNELSSKTMEAKKVPGLYFIGEVVDVTGWLGGYNFQWAWSSGWVAGQVV